jgi:hypothetical protein
VLATEFCWRTPPPEQARQVFLGQVCPGMVFDTVDDWAQLRSSAGLVGVETQTGPFEVMTPRGFLADEGPAHNLTIMTRVASRPANNRKMARLMPRMAKAVPYLGYVLGGQRKAAVIIVGQPHDRTVIARSARRGEPPSRRR